MSRILNFLIILIFFLGVCGLIVSSIFNLFTLATSNPISGGFFIILVLAASVFAWSHSA